MNGKEKIVPILDEGFDHTEGPGDQYNEECCALLNKPSKKPTLSFERLQEIQDYNHNHRLEKEIPLQKEGKKRVKRFPRQSKKSNIIAGPCKLIQVVYRGL